jgi:hypothetical protein
VQECRFITPSQGSGLMGLSMGGWATYSSALGIQTQQVYLEKPFTKLGLMEWLKVKALSLSPSTAKRKKKKHT